jgi:hypothetical protein
VTGRILLLWGDKAGAHRLLMKAIERAGTGKAAA